MFKKLKPKSEFSRNVLTLMTGTTIAQAIPIAISPILTRLYTPEDFGIFALYMSIASMVSVVATGRYELAIMLPKKDEDAVNIMFLSILIAFSVSIFTFLIVLLFNTEITNLLGNQEISEWLYFIPITIFLTGIYQSFNYWSNRKNEYKRLASSKVAQSGTTAVSNIAISFSGFSNGGLIIGSILGQGVATIVLSKIIWVQKSHILKSIKKRKIILLMKKYNAFPKINLPHSFLNAFSTNFPVLIIGYFFRDSILGLYSLGNKIILLPMGIITNSYRQVFYQKISLSNSNRKLIFAHSLKQLLLYPFIPFAILFIAAPNLFKLIFGEKWYIAGVYTQILLPMLYLRFVGSILSSVVLIYNKQEKAFIIEIINTIVRILALIIGGLLHNIILGLILFVLGSSIITIYRLLWYRDIVNKGTKNDN